MFNVYKHDKLLEQKNEANKKETISNDKRNKMASNHKERVKKFMLEVIF